ncbi:MAG: hypothetical protein RL199_848 [Pseudomonadota bacterium]|jgi:translocation and assembly module TamB
MTRRRLAATVLVLAVAAGLPGVLVGTAAGRARLCAAAAEGLQAAVGDQVSLGACRLSPLAGGLRIEDVRIGASAHPQASLEALEVRFSWRSLLVGRLRLEALTLVRPSLTLIAGQGLLAPRASRPAQQSACLPAAGRLDLGTVRVERGTLRLALDDGRRIEADAVDAVLSGGSPWQLGVDVRSARLVEPEHTTPLDTARIRLHLAPGSARAQVDELSLHAPGLSLRATADIEDLCAGRGSAVVTVAADLARTALPRLDGLGPRDGRIAADLRLGLDGAASTARAEVRLDALRLGRFGPFDAEATLRAGRERLWVERFVGRLDTGRLEATGELGLSGDLPLHAEATARDFVLGELLTRLGIPDLTTHLTFDGRVEAEGPLAGDGGLHLGGRIDGTVGEFAVFDRPWHQRAKPGQAWVRFADARSRGSFTLDASGIDVSNVDVRTGRTHARVDGRVFFGPRGLDLAYDFPELALEDLGPFGPADCRGAGHGRGVIRGPYRALDVRAFAEVDGLEVMRVQLDHARATAHMDIGRIALDVTGASGVIGRSSWHGGMSMDFGHGRSDGRVDFEAARVSDLAGVARAFAPSLERLGDSVEASATGSLRVSGPVSRLDGVLEAALSDGRLLGTRLGDGRLSATMSEAAAWTVDTLQLGTDTHGLHGNGAFALKERAFRLDFEARGLELSGLAAVRERWPAASGVASAHVSGEGTLDAPEAEASVTVDRMDLGAGPPLRTRLDARVSQGAARVHGVVTARRGAEPEAMRHVVDARIDLAAGWPFTLEGTFDLPAAEAFWPDRPDGVAGAVRGSFTTSGRLDDPDDMRGELSFDRVSYRQGPLSVVNDGPATARWEAGRLVVDDLPLTGRFFRVGLRGERRRDGTLDLTATGRADLSEVGRLWPSLGPTRGEARLSVTVGGRLSNPDIIGQAELAGLAAAPPGLPLRFEEGRGSLLFSPSAIVGDGLEVRVNGAAVMLDGRAELDAFQPRRADLQVAFDALPVRIDDKTNLTLSGRTTLNGTPQQLTLAGDLQLDTLRFKRDLELERTVVHAVEIALQRRPPPVPRVLDAAGDRVLLDLGLHLGDVRIENNLLQSQLAGDLRLLGTLKRPGLLGALELQGARARLRNAEFAVSHGTLAFNDPTRLSPSFDLHADAAVREFLVHVAASGTARDPRLSLSSQPALPEADILTLLALGVTSRDFERTGGTSLGGVLLDAAYNGSGLGEEVRRLLPADALLRDTKLRVTSAYNELSGNIEPVAQFESRLRWDKVRLKGQAGLLGRMRKLQGEWRLSDDLSGVVQIDSDNPNVPTADWGADLKWQTERP